MLRLSVISPTATYQLARSVSNVDEGSVVTITLTTTGVQNGQAIPYSLSGTGITSADFVGSPALSGNFVIQNNSSFIILAPSADLLLEGPETLVITLTLENGASVSVDINDTSYQPVDLLWSQVTGLWHMDDVVDGAAMSGLAGDGQAANTRWGSASSGYTTDSKFGARAMLIPWGATGSYRVGSNSVFTGDFTVEFWVKRTSGGSTVPSQDSSDRYVSSNAWYANQSNAYSNVLGNNISHAQYILPLNSWAHMALCRSGSTVRLFKDGIMLGSTTSTAPADFSQLQFAVNGNANTMPRVVDEVRLSKVARYTSNFAVPTTAFPSSAS